MRRWCEAWHRVKRVDRVLVEREEIVERKKDSGELE